MRFPLRPTLCGAMSACLFVFALSLFAPLHAQDVPQTEEPAAAATGPDPAQFSAQALELINAYRGERGLPVLQADPLLERLALQHSRYMQAKDELSHDDFISRFVASGGQRCVENVGWNYKSGQALVEGWKKSPLHDKNLLDSKISLAGVALAGKYSTFLACVPLAR